MFMLKNSAKALIYNDRTVLMLKKRYEDDSILYTLPGGSQQAGELLSQTLIREVYEETGAHIEVIDLVHVYEHFRPSRQSPDTDHHKVEFAFLCRLTQTYQPKCGQQPDPHQIAVEWVDPDQIGQLNFNPAGLTEVLTAQIESRPVYMDDIG